MLTFLFLSLQISQHAPYSLGGGPGPPSAPLVCTLTQTSENKADIVFSSPSEDDDSGNPFEEYSCQTKILKNPEVKEKRTPANVKPVKEFSAHMKW